MVIACWAIDLSQGPQRLHREKSKKLCDLSGLCEITRKCLQLNKFLMAEIRTNPRSSNIAVFMDIIKQLMAHRKKID
jgi:hypothetical protein